MLSLVSKAWRELSQPYRNIYAISSKPEDTSGDEWHAHFDRNGENLFNINPHGPVLLHIGRMQQETEGLEIPDNMLDVLVKIEDRLAGLSVQLELLQRQYFREQDFLVCDMLVTLARKLQKVHIWSHDDYLTDIQFRGKVLGSVILWPNLADLIWGPGTPKATMQVLSLSTCRIRQAVAGPRIPAYPVQTLLLTDVYFGPPVWWTILFPEVEDLVLRQTVHWPGTTQALNLMWNIGKNLRTLRIIWSKDPFPLMWRNCKILESPNLESICIQAGTDFDTSGFPHDTSPLPTFAYLFPKAKLLKYLTIEGIDLLGTNMDIGQLCAAFKSPNAAPALASVPRFTLHKSDTPPARFASVERRLINAGLTGLRKRGLHFGQVDLDETVWKHSLNKVHVAKKDGK